jgi:hypothetical protein
VQSPIHIRFQNGRDRARVKTLPRCRTSARVRGNSTPNSQLPTPSSRLSTLDESAITRIVEKTKQPGFNPRQLEEEVGNVVSAVKAAGQK